MRTRPNAIDLLDIAREVLQHTLLSQLPAALRYQGLMVANALANAQREIAAGEEPLRTALARLVTLYGETAEPLDAVQLGRTLERLTRRLVADIRTGKFDGDPTVADHVFIAAIARVQESNPKYLVGREISDFHDSSNS